MYHKIQYTEIVIYIPQGVVLIFPLGLDSADSEMSEPIINNITITGGGIINGFYLPYFKDWPTNYKNNGLLQLAASNITLENIPILFF